MAEEYLIKVKTLFDTASLRDYIKESVEGIKRIAAEAARAQSAPQRQVAQEQLQAQQANTGATLAAARDSGLIPNADLERAAKTLATQFEKQAKAGNVQLAKTEQLTAVIDSELANRRRLATAPAYELNNNQFKERFRQEERKVLAEGLERLKRTTKEQATGPAIGRSGGITSYQGPDHGYKTKADAERAYGAALKANAATDLPKADQAHQLAITRALAAGVPVSEKVLAGYQGLEATVKARIRSEDATQDAAIRTAAQAEASAKAGQQMPAKIARLEAELDKATTAYKRVAEAAQSAPQAHFNVAAAQLRQAQAAESLSGARAQLGRTGSSGQSELFDPASAKLTNPRDVARNAAKVELARIEAQEQALLGVRARLLEEANTELRAHNENAGGYNKQAKEHNAGKLKRDQIARIPLLKLKDYLTPGQYDKQQAEAGKPKSLALQFQENQRALEDVRLRSPEERAGGIKRTTRDQAVDALNAADQRLLEQLNAQAGPAKVRATAQRTSGIHLQELTAEHAKQVVSAATNAALEQKITVHLSALQARILRESESFKSGAVTLSGKSQLTAHAQDPAKLLADLEGPGGSPYYEGHQKVLGKARRGLASKVQSAVDDNVSKILRDQGEGYSDPRVQETAREAARVENYYRGKVPGINSVSLKTVGYTPSGIAKVDASILASRERQEAQRAAKAGLGLEGAPAGAPALGVAERGALQTAAQDSATAVATAGIPALAQRKAELFGELIKVQGQILKADQEWLKEVAPIPGLAKDKAKLFRELINAQKLILDADKKTLEAADATASHAANAAGTRPIVVPAGKDEEDAVFAAQSRREQAKRHELTEAGGKGRAVGQSRPGQDRVIFPLGDGAYGEVDAGDIAQKKRVRIAKGLADAGAPAQGQDESDVAAQGRLRNARIIALNNAIVADTEGLREATAATLGRAKAERSATNALNKLSQATTEELRELAEARVLGHKERGQVSAVISGDPTLVKDEVEANVRNRHLKSQINTGTVAAESQLIGSGDEAALHQLNQRIITAAAERVRKLVERGASEDLILKETKTLGQLVQQENLRHYEYLKFANQLVTDVKADERAVKEKAVADARAAKEAEKQAAVAAEQIRQANLPSTFYQRFQAQSAQRKTQGTPGGGDGRPPPPAASFPTFGQAIGSGIATTLRFATSGLLLYQGASTIKKLVTDSAELDALFRQLQVNMVAVGRGDQFEGLKKAIGEVAAKTGGSLKDTTTAATKAEGAFGAQGTGRVRRETESIVELSKVGGIPIEDAASTGIAAAKAFGVSVRDVGDAATGVFTRTGIPIKETAAALGTVGVAAKSAGLNVGQMAALMGVLEQTSRKTGVSMAELLNRVFPALQANAGKVLDTLRRNPATASTVPKIGEELSKGQTGQALIDIIGLTDKLTVSQRHNLESSLGGTRGAVALAALLERPKEALAALAAANDNGGKQAVAFASHLETLGGRLDKLKEAFQAVGIAIYKAGLEQLLKDAAIAAGLVLSIILPLIQAFASLNHALGGIPVQLLAIYLGFKALGALGRLNVLGLLGGGRRAAAGVEGVAKAVPGAIGGARAVTVETVAGGGGLFGGLGAGIAGRFGAAKTAAELGGQGRILGAAPAGALGANLAGGLGVIGPVGLTAIAGLAVNQTYQSVKKQNEIEAKRFTDKLKHASYLQLEQILRDRGSLFEQIGAAVGIETPSVKAGQQIGKKNLEQDNIRANIQAARDSGVLHNARQTGILGTVLGLADDGGQIADKALGGDSLAQAQVDKQLTALLQHPKRNAKEIASFKAALEKIRAAVAAEQERIAVESAKDAELLADAKTQYENGELSLGELYASYHKANAALRENIKFINNPDDATSKTDSKQLKANETDESHRRSLTARAIVDSQVESVDLGGGDATKAKVEGLTKLLGDPVLDPAEAKKAVIDLNAALRQELNERADQAQSAAERVAILRAGIAIPPQSQVAKLKADIIAYDTEFTDYLSIVAGGGEAATALLTEAVTKAVNEAITVTAAVRALARKKAAELSGVLAVLLTAHPGGNDDIGEIIAAIGRYTAAGAEGPEGPPEAKFKPTPKINATPTQVAQADKAAKSEDRTAADKAHAEAEAVARAKLALEKAIHEGDPVALAQAGIDEARLALSLATKDSEKINAQAQLVLAQHALIKARADVADAYLNLDKAQAAATGDVIRVADDEIKAAQLHLDNARERGNLMETLAAEAALTGANANKISVQIGKGTKDVDTGLALERISTQEAIAELELLQRIPGETKDQYDQLQIKINALRKSASANINFDIPTEIKLPTLYEVRRLQQTESKGGGYQDNRQVAVQYNVFTPQDNQGALQDLVGVMSGSPRVGPTPRTYP